MSEKPVNVLVTNVIGEHNFRYAVNLSPRISVKDASPLVQAELKGDSFPGVMPSRGPILVFTPPG